MAQKLFLILFGAVLAWYWLDKDKSRGGRGQNGQQFKGKSAGAVRPRTSEESGCA
jgi:hypothetical protein